VVTAKSPSTRAVVWAWLAVPFVVLALLLIIWVVLGGSPSTESAVTEVPPSTTIPTTTSAPVTVVDEVPPPTTVPPPAPPPPPSTLPVVGGDPLRSGQTHVAQLSLEQAWLASTGSDQVIAIVDTGVDLTHPDLAERLVPGVNLVAPGTPPQDDHGHGTHVAGIAAAATGNDVGVSGVAPGARIMPVKVLDASGNGSTAVIAAGIEWAVANGATVVNLSLGDAGVGTRLTKGGQLNRAIRFAAERGVVVVAAAGNDAALEVDYRRGVDVIVVNAVDANGTPAPFTDSGDPRAVAAPGVDILATAPAGPSTIWPSGTPGYDRLSGTSMATPIVSGIAALLRSRGVPPAEVGPRLAATATAGPDPRLGAGIVNPLAALG